MATEPSKRHQPGVPAEDMEFAEGDDDSVSTKVGTAGWPDGAENDPNVGPTGETLDKDGNPASESKPAPAPQSTQQTTSPPSSSEG